jgi:hypothetical protein
LKLEIKERKMGLKEHDIALRKAAAEVEAIELANINQIISFVMLTNINTTIQI